MVPKDVECRNIGRMTYQAPRYRGVQTSEFQAYPDNGDVGVALEVPRKAC